MKIIHIKSILSLAVMAVFANACSKMKEVNTLATGGYTDTTTALKDVSDAGIMGVAIEHTSIFNDATYNSIVKKDFNQVTFGNLMKHSSIVSSTGVMNFTNTDALVAAVGNMNIYGHTLLWHSQQSAIYIKDSAGITIPAATELVSNPGFEEGTTNWNVFNTNGATISFVTGDAANAHAGNAYMKVVNPNNNAGGEWRVQVSSANLATAPGQPIVISYWIKAAAPGGSIRLSTGPSAAQYQNGQTIGTTWQQVSWTITPTLSNTTILFDMGLLANTYFIDDVSVKKVVTAPTGDAITLKVDQILNNYITTMVGRYESKVKAWDVVNEVISPSGAVRTSANSTDVTNKTANGIFFWGDYLGRNHVLKAFQYAAAADPSALLFINDYALESNTAKLDSLIALVGELKSKGAKVDGIGTQMHISRNTSYDGIDKMFQKLAATGLKVHISELDVRLNPNSIVGYTLTEMEQNYQAAMYYHVISSYLKHVPKAQQYGITIWGIADHTSWLYDNGKDFPLMWDKNYAKKLAYAAVVKALKGQ